MGLAYVLDPIDCGDDLAVGDVLDHTIMPGHGILLVAKAHFAMDYLTFVKCKNCVLTTVEGPPLNYQVIHTAVEMVDLVVGINNDIAGVATDVRLVVDFEDLIINTEDFHVLDPLIYICPLYRGFCRCALR